MKLPTHGSLPDVEYARYDYKPISLLSICQYNYEVEKVMSHETTSRNSNNLFPQIS